MTGIFRIFGGSAEGTSYAIIFSNLLVPLIERDDPGRLRNRKGEEERRRGSMKKDSIGKIPWSLSS
jgi:Na+-translocating ferredoxin:NAD+ oxidoreductase RnfD subunit